MPNIPHEQILVESFMNYLYSTNNENEGLRIVEEINRNCKSKIYADLEFTTNADHWVIEAKSNISKDLHNSAHKVFGELLKETGKQRNIDDTLQLKYGILIPDRVFYKKKFNQINREKFEGFGQLIPVEKIFVFNNNQLEIFDWLDFYDSTDSDTSHL